MFKQSTLTKALVAAGLCGVASLALAGGPDMPVAHQELYHGGVFLGGAVGTNSLLGEVGGTGFGTVVGYNNDYMTVSLMTGAQRFNTGVTGAKKPWIISLDPELAYRQRVMMSNVFWKAGLGGIYDIETNKATGEKNPWGIGAFGGLDYQATRHLQASVSLYPVMYQTNQTATSTKTHTLSVLGAGNLSLSYVF